MGDVLGDIVAGVREDVAAREALVPFDDIKAAAAAAPPAKDGLAALRAPGVDTAITSVISGRPARGIVTRFIREAGAPGHPPVPDYPIAYDAGKELNAAARAGGSAQFAAHWAGQGVSLLREMPAAELVATLAAEMRA